MSDVHPDGAVLVAAGRAAGSRPYEAMSPAQAREAYAARRELVQLPADAVSVRRDFSVPGPGRAIPLRLYRPLAALDDGRIDNAASIIALQWLALNHDKVRERWA